MEAEAHTIKATITGETSQVCYTIGSSGEAVRALNSAFLFAIYSVRFIGLV